MGIIVAIPAIPGAIIDHYAMSHRQTRDPVRHRKRASETAIGVLCLFLVVLVAIIDYRSGAGQFHPVLPVNRRFRRLERESKGRLLIALASSLAAFVGEASHNLPTGVLFWNLGVQTGISLFVVLLLSAVRNLTRTSGAAGERTDPRPGT